MTMENQVTSIGQSKRLQELGVPAENASMCWSEIAGERRLIMKVPGPYVVPAFTVADLLGMLPFEIEYEGVEMYVSFIYEEISKSLYVCYESPEYGWHRPYVYYQSNPMVSSIVSCIEWLSENGIKLKL